MNMKRVDDLVEYLKTKNMKLTEESKEFFIETENIGSLFNNDLYYGVYLIAFFLKFQPLKDVLLRKGKSPEAAVEFIEKSLSVEGVYDEYTDGGLYSEAGYRSSCKTLFIDSVLSAAKRNQREFISIHDLFEGLLDLHDEGTPAFENHTWTDKRLQVSFNTLTHIIGKYSDNLWVKLDEIREEFMMVRPDVARAMPIDKAPMHIKGSLLSFFVDNPEYYNNVFIIMPFHETEFHKKIFNALKRTLNKAGFNPLRVDNKTYSDDVLSNIETYLYGSRFCIAVHERNLSDDHNANVAFEVGYTLGLKKSVCLLKEKTVKALPSDLQGRIYVQFDGANIEESINTSITNWINDKELKLRG
jgi:CAP12/Pycsar effector protein, TIR domain